MVSRSLTDDILRAVAPVRRTMPIDSILHIAQLSTIVIGGLGVFVALRSHKRQMHAQIFIEFSSRFHTILGRLPFQAWTGAESGGGPLPPPSDELTRSILQCFHIMADLFHLHEGGYISQDLWDPWQQGMRRTLRGPLLRREWATIRPAFSHHPAFCHYVHTVMEAAGSVRVFNVPYTANYDDPLLQSAF